MISVVFYPISLGLPLPTLPTARSVLAAWGAVRRGAGDHSGGTQHACCPTLPVSIVSGRCPGRTPAPLLPLVQG